jgi:hypothetical protein
MCPFYGGGKPLKKYLAVLAGIGLIAATAIAVPGLAGDKNKGETTVACGNNGTITASPTTLWPPNHKDVPILFTYTDDDSDGTSDVSLEIIATPHNEIVEGEEINGTGNTPAATDSLGGAATDSDGSVDVTGSARAERSGHLNDAGGRVYEFDYVAQADMMTDGCESDPMTEGDGIIVFVPHDCRAVDGGNSACNAN